MATADTFSGVVRVASSIVDYLSSGLYESSAACLKELINNSYDADATAVHVFVKPDADRIIIEDDGTGFTRDEFVEHFSHVSESAKRDDSDATKSGRKKVGLIGIGFIAANEICEEMEIFSTVAGSTELLHVTVDFRTMRQSREERQEQKRGAVKKGDFHGEVTTARRDEHYTRIFLKQIRENAQEMFVGAQKSRGIAGSGVALYGLNQASIRKKLAGIKTWGDLDFYSQTMLKVALNVPVRYVDGWCPSDVVPAVRPFVKRTEALNFRVNYDGTDLRKPIVLSDGTSSHVLRAFSLRGEHIAASGYLYATHGTIEPMELNGVLVRIREAAVGEHDSTFMGFPKTIGPLFQRWITSEVWADDRLEGAMNIDRRTLRQAHDSYAELQSLFHKELESFVSEVRSKLYSKPASDRRGRQAKSQAETISRIIEEESKGLPPAARKRITSAWRPQPGDGQSGSTRQAANRRLEQQLVKKYSLADIYEVVVEVASDVLPPAERRRFLEALTERLREGL